MLRKANVTKIVSLKHKNDILILLMQPRSAEPFIYTYIFDEMLIAEKVPLSNILGQKRALALTFEK